MKRKIILPILLLIPLIAFAVRNVQIWTKNLPNGQTTVAYSTKVQAKYGTKPYTFTLASGALPDGLSLNANGTISGTPTVANTFNFSILVTDSAGSPTTNTKSFAITIAGTAPVTPPSIVTTSVPSGFVGAAYSTTIQAIDGTLPYVWTSTTLPPGLSINSSTGAITGTPTVAGSYNFTVTVTDAGSLTYSRAYAITIIGTASNIIESDFESGTFTPPFLTNTDGNVTISTDQAVSGTKSAKILYAICGVPQAAPTLAQVASGTLGARTYYVKITYKTLTFSVAGETTVSPQASLAVNANNVLRVSSPPSHPNVTGYNVYVSTTSGNEVKQNASPVAIGVAWTEPNTGLVSLGTPPTSTTGCRSDHQDDNHSFDYTNAGGLNHWFLREKVYFKSPETGANSNQGRKLLYVRDNTSFNPGSYSIILATLDPTTDFWPGDGPIFLTWSLQSGTIGGGSYVVDCGITWGTPISGLGCNLQYDTWYTIEMEVKNSTVTAAPWDGIVRIWVNGTSVYENTGWSLNRGLNLPLKRWNIGQQTDRPNFNYPVYEYRYIDDVAISTSYIGP